MFQVYMKVALRSLFKNRLYTGINLAGLSIGLAVGLLMLLWTQDELTYDNFHPDSERIFRENAHLTTGGKTQSWAAVPAPHALYALQEIPEVEKAVRIDGDSDHPVFRYGSHSQVEKKGAFVDSSFFEVFKTEIYSGNPAKPFENVESIVLTETLAKKYFGNSNALGKILEVGSTKAVVTAVIRDFPGNSIFQFQYLRNMELLKQHYQGGETWQTVERNWGTSGQRFFETGRHRNGYRLPHRLVFYAKVVV